MKWRENMNNNICLVADSGGYLPKEILTKYDISVVPFYITLDGEKYLVQGKDITDEELYKIMQADPNILPKTSAPNPEDWYNVLLEKFKKGCKNILMATMSSDLSASYNNANLAKELFIKDYPDCEVKLIDTRTCTCGQSAMEIKLAQLIEKGKHTLEQLYDTAKDLISKTHTIFSVKTLKYMEAGGRIGEAAKYLGILLKINPISEFLDGVVKPIKISRTRKKALESMVDIAAERIKDPKNTIICTRSALFEEDQEYLITKLKEKLNYQGKIYSGTLEAVIGAHSGPGAIGIGFVTE
jgi:DegV family protein with EDD domain